MRSMTAGTSGVDGQPLSTMEIVNRLLLQMKGAALTHNMRVFEEKSDELATFAMAHLVPDIPETWRPYKFTRHQSIIADILYKNLGKVVPYGFIMNGLYFDRPDDPPGIQVLKVRICHMRKKFQSSPYDIETVWGVGFRMVRKQSQPESIAA